MLGLSRPNDYSSSSDNVLTLAEILRRSVSIEWHEGVALVRATIDRLGSSSSSASIPELHQVELAPSGRVDVTGGSVTDEPVRRLGQLLQATFGRSDPPVQLRLMISQATAPTPAFGSIREFDEVLGYYERPNRDASLQALYERAAAAPPMTETQANVTLDTLAPLPSKDRPKPPKPPKSPQARRQQRKLAFMAAVLLVLVAAGVYTYRNLNATESQQVAEIAAKASDVVGSAVVTGLSKVTETVGLGRLVSEPSNAPPPAPAPTSVLTPAPAASDSTRRAAREPLPSVAIPVQVFDLDVKPSVIPSPDEPASAPAPDAETPAPTSNGGNEPDMYTPAHGEVSPPIGVRPQLPRELPPNLRREDLTRIELIIAADGTVELVKLVSSPKTVHDAMWLSAIKAWQFQPALKGGRPVRYLKTVWIAPQ